MFVKSYFLKLLWAQNTKLINSLALLRTCKNTDRSMNCVMAYKELTLFCKLVVPKFDYESTKNFDYESTK